LREGFDYDAAIVTDVPDYRKDFTQIRLSGRNGELEVLSATVVGNYFRIQAMPLYVNGFSRHDIVEAIEVKPDDLDGYGVVGSAGVFEFVRVKAPSGNRTLRILFDRPLQESDPRMDLIDHLSTLHCDYGGNEHRYAVSVRPNAEINDVRNYLNSCGFRWEYSDPAEQVT
jgi:hypothetical protein